MFLGPAGCGATPQLEDNIDFLLNWSPLPFPFVSQDDVLHSPYVKGATFSISVLDNGDFNNSDLKTWTLESSAPEVLQIIGTPQALRADVAAVGVGASDLIVRDGDHQVLRTRRVEVRAPDSALVLSHGPLLIGESDADAAVDGVRVRIGGTATFMLKWFSGTEELAGNGVLSVARSGTVDIKTPETMFFEHRDWLQVTPTDATPVDLHLLADGIDVRPLVVIPAAPGEVSSVGIFGDSERGASKGEQLVLLGEAFDSSGSNVLGVDFFWDVDGSTVPGFGDVLRYDFTPTHPAMLTATSFDGPAASVAVHEGNAAASSSNDVGCSISGRARNGTAALWALLIALALSARPLRRRSR